MSTDSPFDQIIQKRYSPRAFVAEDLPPHVIEQLWQAARTAPSSFNEQPWRFIYARHSDEEAFSRILSSLSQKNQAWAKDAGLLTVVAARRAFSHNGVTNRHAWYDSGAAVSTMVLKATELDIYARQMAGFDPVKAQELLQIPEDFEAVVVVAFGYNAEQERISRPRLSKEEFVFQGKWQS